MYCEKCGKMNPEGAMFCSNCSSILRSRRSNTVTENTAKPESETKRITITHDAEPIKTTGTGWEDKYTARTAPSYTKKRSAPVSESLRNKNHYYDEYEDEPAEKIKFCSAWCNVLSVVSWIIFIVMTAIGLIGGGALIAMGIKDGESMFYFGGTAVMILFVIMAFAYHARNIVQIKILKKLNEKR